MLTLDVRNVRPCSPTEPRNGKPLAPRRWWRRAGILLAASLAIAQPTTDANGQNSWNGGDGDWDVAANWSAGLPSATTDAVNATSGVITHGSALADIINSFLNSSTGGLIVNAGSLTVNTDYQNTGSGSLAVNGGALDILGNLINSGNGNITVGGGTLQINGNFNTNGDLTLASGGVSGNTAGATPASRFQAGGAVTLSGGTLSNFIIDAAQSGAFALNGGTIRNSQIQNSNLLLFDASDNQLDNVTLQGGLNLTANNSSVHLVNGTTFSSGDQIVIGATYTNFPSNGQRLLSLDTDVTLNHNTITFGNWSDNVLVVDGNSTLTVDQGSLIHGAIGTIQGSFYTTGSSTLDNYGTISFDTPALVSSAASTIGGNGLDTIINRNGGVIEVNNAVQQEYQDQSLSIQSATFTNAAGGTVQAVSTGYSNAGLLIAVTDLNNSGVIQAVSTQYGAASVVLQPTNYDTPGIITASGARSQIFLFGGSGIGLTTAQLGNISGTNGGTIYLGTTVNNTGAIFDPNAITGTGANAGQLVLGGAYSGGNSYLTSGSQIIGGSIVNSMLLRFSTNDNVLDGVKLDGLLDLSQGGFVRLTNGTSFNNANPAAALVFNIGNTSAYNYNSDGAMLDFDDTRVLGNATITFGNSAYASYSEGGTSGNYLVIDGNNTLTIAHDTLIHGAAGSIVGNYYDSGAGVLDNHGKISFDAPLSDVSQLGSGIGSGLATVINESDGLIEANSNIANNPNKQVQALTLNPMSLNNLGTIQAVSTSGGNVSLYVEPASYVNVGAVIANGANAAVYLGETGGGAGAVLTPMQLTGVSAINGGTIYFSTKLNNVGTTFDPTTITGTGANAGQFAFDGGSIQGGSVINSMLLRFGQYGTVLDDVALDGLLDLSQGGHVTLINGTSFNNANPGAPLIFNLGSRIASNGSQIGGTLEFGDSRTLSNTTITFGDGYTGSDYARNGSGNGLIIDGANTLTIAHDTLIHGAAGSIVGSSYGQNIGTLDNHGAISFDAPTSYSNGLAFYGNNIGYGLATVSNESDGLIEVNGTPANNPNNRNQSLTINPNVLNNPGTIQAINTGGGKVTLYVAPASYQNVGAIIANGINATVYLENSNSQISFTTAQIAGIAAANGGTIYLATTLDNTGAIFDPNAITGTGTNAGHLIVGSDGYYGGRILGGTVVNSTLLHFTNDANVLDGVALDGSLDLSQRGQVQLVNGTSFNTANPTAPLILNLGSTVASNNSQIGATLEFGESLTLSNATVTFGNSAYAIANNGGNNALVIDGNSTLTIAHDTLIQGAAGNIVGSYFGNTNSVLDNHGAIRFDTPAWGNVYFSDVVGSNLTQVSNESDGLIEVNSSAANNPNKWLQALTINPATLDNLGTIQAISTGGGPVNLTIATGDYASLGKVVANGAAVTLYLQGANGFSSATGLTTAQLAGVSLVNGSTLYLQTTVDNTGATFDPTALTGTGGNASHLILGGADSDTLSGSHIIGGNIVNSNLLHFGWGNNILDGVALDGVIDLSKGGQVYLINGTSFNNAAPGTPLILNIGSVAAIPDSYVGALLGFGDTRTLSNATITFGNSNYGGNVLEIDGSNTLTIAHDTLIHGAAGAIQGSPFNGQGVLDNHGLISFDAPPTGPIYNGNDIGGNLSAVINASDGLIEINSNATKNPNQVAQSLRIDPATLDNPGAIQAISTNGAAISLYLSPNNYQSVGSISANGANSTVYFYGGGGYLTGTGFSTAQSAGISATNGGTVSIDTVLNNTGATFDPTTITGTGPTAGHLILGDIDGSHILGGSIVNSALLHFGNGDNILDGVALDGVVDLSQGGHVRVTNGTSFNTALPGVPAIFNIGSNQQNNDNQSGALLDFDDTRTLSFTAITFGNSYYAASDDSDANYLIIDGGHTLTIAHNTFINGAAGTIRGNYYDPQPTNGTLDNHGVIRFDTPAWDGGFGTTSAIYDLAEVVNESDGLIEVNNSAANNPNNWGQSLLISPTLLINQGIIRAINTGGGSSAITLAPNNYGTVGTVIANGALSAVYLQGGGGYMTGTGFTTAQSAGISALNGGAIYLQTTLNNVGATFDPNAITGTGTNAGSLILGSSDGYNSSRILGGSIVNTGLLHFGQGDNRLDGVQSFDTGLNLSDGGYAHLIGTTDMAAFPTDSIFKINNSGLLALDGSGSDNSRILDNVTIAFGGVGVNRLTAEGNTTLILGDHLTFLGKNGAIGGDYYGAAFPGQQYDYGQNTVINNAALTFTISDGNWTFDPVSLVNNATMQAQNGTTLTLASVSYENNSMFFNSGTVTADGSDAQGTASVVALEYYSLTNNGTLQAISGGKFQITPASYAAIGTILANGQGSLVALNAPTTGGIALASADAIIAGNGGKVTLSANSIANGGTLAASGGGQIVITNGSTGPVTSTGAISIANGSTIDLFPHGLQQTGATAVATVDGTLQLHGDDFDVQGGTLKGSGDIYGNVNNSATVAPGDSIGKLSVHGNYTQTAAGLLDIVLGGAQAGTGYSTLAVSNQVTLAGLLTVKLVNGYAPAPGATFDFLTYGGRTGQFDQIVSLNGGYTYSVDFNDTTGTASLVVVTTGVPEMSTVGTMALMLSVGGIALRRRRRAA